MNLVSLCFFAPLQFTVHYSTESGLFLDPDTNEGEVLTYPSGSLHDSSERWIKEWIWQIRQVLTEEGLLFATCQQGFSTETYYICLQRIWFTSYHVCKSHKGARMVYPRASHWPTFCDIFLMFIHMQQFLKTPWVIVEILQRLWNKHQYWSSWPTRCQFHTIERSH